MASTDYTVNILMNMRDTISRAAESAARAMGILERETTDAADALEAFAGLNVDIDQSLASLGDSANDAVSGLADLGDEAGASVDELDNLAAASGDAGDELDQANKSCEDAIDSLEATAKASGDAGKGLLETGEGADKAATAMEKLSKTIGEVVTVAAIMKGAQEALKFLELGAQIDETRTKFYGFSGGAVIATENLRLFREATQGTVTDVQGMEVVTKLMGMGLVDNAAQMAQVAGMAVQLGDQHQEAGERIMDFARMLQTGSTRRLFEYNISVANVEQRMKDLQATTAGLSKDEAFKLAVLAEGTLQLAKLGDAGLSADDKMDRIKVSLENVKNIAAESALRILDASGALDTLSKSMPQLPETISQLVTLFGVMDKIPLANTLADIAPKLNPVYWTFKLLGEVLKGVVWGLGEVATFMVNLAVKNDGLRLSLYNALPAEYKTNEELNKMAAQAATASAKVNDLSRDINAVPAKKTTVLEVIAALGRGVKSILGLEGGGIVTGLQSGGIASGLTMVGERGPELVQLPVGSRVYSHEQSTTINQTFNQTVNTRASSGTVAMDFQMLRSLAT